MLYQPDSNTLIKEFSGDYASEVETVLSKYPHLLKNTRHRSILIKPNIWYPHPRGSGSISDPYLVCELARCFLDAGANKVVVGEGTAVGYAFEFNHTTLQALEVSGYSSALKRLNVPFIDLNSDSFVRVKSDDLLVFKSINIAKSIMEHEILINVPVMKTHYRTKVTLGMKNLKGVLSPQDKKNCHKLGLDEGIVDLNYIIKPDFTLIDGIRGMEGLWEYPGDTVQADLLVASSCPISADFSGARLMGIDPYKVRHLALAKKLNLFMGSELITEKVPPNLVKRFIDPGTVLQNRFPETSLCIKDACTGCYGAITAPLIKVYHEKLLDKLINVAIFSGPNISEEEVTEAFRCNKKIFIGLCTSPIKTNKFNSIYVKGCPPSQDAVMNAFINLLKK